MSSDERPQTRPAVLVISSHVARGSVGNRGIAFALERLGFTAWVVPTVLLPHHPGHGPAPRIVPDGSEFRSFLDALIEGPRTGELAGILSGYLASAEQADAVASAVKRIKAARPEALYLCDPVMGDAGRLYVGESLAAAIRDRLLPLADITTPNRFECAWLAGERDVQAADAAALARRLARPAVLVTSAPALMRGHIGNLLVQDGASVLIEHPLVQTTLKGTGDLLAALVLGRKLEGHGLPKALELAASSTFEILAGSQREGADELMLARFQQAITHPRAPVNIHRIGGRA